MQLSKNRNKRPYHREKPERRVPTSFPIRAAFVFLIAATFLLGSISAVHAQFKIVVAGDATPSSSDFGVVRYNIDGSLDTTFGTGGKVITDIGGYQDICNAVSIQSDGKIVVVGSAETGGIDRDFAVIRYNIDGTLDTSFSGDGKVTTSFGIGDQSGANAVAIQSDGKIVVVGYSGSAGYNNFAVARYNSDGTLDTSFSGDGILTTDFGTDDDIAYAVTIQSSDSRIVVAGYATISSNKSWAVARYNTDGSLDTSFDTDGMLTTDFGSNIEEARGVAIQSDGKIVVAGYTTISGTAFAAARYTSNGTLDSSFGTSGKVTTDIGASTDSSLATAIQTDGKIVLAGYSYTGTNYDFAVVRYDTGGSLDTSFDTDGIVTTNISNSDYGRAVAISIDCESQDWWDINYVNRRQLTIDAAVSGYSIKLVLTGADAAEIYGNCLASGNDFRVVWYNGCIWNDLDRELESFSSTNITVWFRIQEPSGWAGGLSNYYLYYGNSSPDPVKANKSNIYDLWDDFININNWTRFTEEGFATSSAFVDGGSVDLPANSWQDVATLSTSFPGGNNFVIAIVQVQSTVALSITTTNLQLQRTGSSTLMSNLYSIDVDSAINTPNNRKWYALMAYDAGAAASQSYTVRALVSATGMSAEAKILAITGVTGAQITGTATQVPDSETLLTTLNTSFGAGDNIVLGIFESENTSNGALQLTNVRLMRGTTELARNEYSIYHGGAGTLQRNQVHFLVALDTGAPASPTYTAYGTSNDSQGQPNINCRAKIVAFRKGTWSASYLDETSKQITSSELTLNTLTTTFAAGNEVVVIASEQFGGNSGTARYILAGNNKLQQNGDTGTQTTNEYHLGFNPTGTGDDGKGFGLLNRFSNTPASPTYTVKAQADACCILGESKVLAIMLPQATPLPSVTTDTINLRVTHTRSMKHGAFHNSFSTSNSYGFAIKTSSRKANLTQGYHGVAGWYHTQDQYGPAGAGPHFYAGETSNANPASNRYVLSKGTQNDADWEQTDTANLLPDTSFHVYETFVKTNGTMRFTRDGATCFPSGGGYSSAETTLTSGRIAIVNEGPTGSPNDSYYAWILVRKFTDPEPTVTAGAPTFVTLVSFTATQYENGVLLRWRTGYEVNNLGFHVYREENGQRVRLTPEPVAGSALLAGSQTALTAGHHYHWWDLSPLDTRPSTLGSVRYWLKDIDLNGTHTMHGPVTPIFSRDPILEKFRPELLSEIGWRLQERYQHYWKAKELKERLKQTPKAKVKVEVKGNVVRPRPAQSLVVSHPLPNPPPSRGRDRVGDLSPKPSSLDSAMQQFLASRPAVKLMVREEGWYRVNQAELVAAGLSQTVDPRYLQLYVDGKEQPIRVLGGKNGRFGSGDAIEFYGVGLDTPSTDTRVYWLVSGSNLGRRIHELKGYQGSLGSLSQSNYPHMIEKKERRIYFAALRNGDEWNFFGPLVYPAVQVDQLFDIRHLDLGASGDALLEVALQGVTTVAHRVKVLVNEVEVGEVVFEIQSRGVASFPISQSLLEEGENVVTLEAWGGEMDASVIETIRLTYWHTYAADDNGLRFTAQGGSHLTVNGFSHPKIRVIDVTEPGEAIEVIGLVEPQNRGYAISLKVPPARGQRTLLALTEEKIKSAEGVVANQPSSWYQEKGGYDFVIISHRDFLGSLDPLRKLRESQRLSVALIDIEDLYDEFCFGAKDPKAIKDFLSHAKRKWQKPPRFVLLVGDASYDPRNYLGLGNFDLVPTKLVDTSYFETASDDWFVDFNNDGLPEMAVGRLPVQRAEEAGIIVSKIVGYERSGTKRETLLVSDMKQRVDDFDFEKASDELRGLLPGSLRVRKIYRSQFSNDAQATQELINGINQGPFLVNFIGHGSIGTWDGVLTSGDVQYLTNVGLPFFVGMSCLNGHFQDIYMDSLSEALMKAPQGGAVAVWFSSGLTEPDRQAVMNKEIIRLLFGKESFTLGEATAKAKKVVSDQDIRRTWILFGDPTTRLK